MSRKRLRSICAMTAITLSFLVGCGENTSAATMDVSVLQTDISKIVVSEEVEIVGLGEASHGVKEYQNMKMEVFKALVNNNDCHTFILEGDFGGALKVDAYIHGGEGNAEEMVKEIGFAIYRTEEMAELIEWMRGYNETAPEGEDLHFYGMDMQRYDNNKEYLFSVLDKAVPEMSKKYKELFANLTDEERLYLDSATLDKAKTDGLALIEEMDAAKVQIIDCTGEEEFAFARECANTIYACTEVLACSNMEYNTLRDAYMFEKVTWFTGRTEGLLFINGHNGHIGKKSIANYTCLGELLSKSLGEKYFAIGTDAMNTGFNSQGNDGSFEVMEVSNRNVLNSQLENLDSNVYYLDFEKTAENPEWKKVLSEEQKITALNVGISGWQKVSDKFYTSTVVPADTFDGMIVFGDVMPTTLYH